MIDNVKVFKCSCIGADIFCLNCQGTGEVDWVSHIIPKAGYDYRMFEIEIRNIMSKYKIEYPNHRDNNALYYYLQSYLEDLKSKGSVSEYSIESEKEKNNYDEYNIIVKPSSTNDTINLTVRMDYSYD